jgi:hypothetical protein
LPNGQDANAAGKAVSPAVVPRRGSSGIAASAHAAEKPAHAA